MRKIVLLALALAPLAGVAATQKAQVIEVQVTDHGFEPGALDVKAGVPVTLKITRKTDATCATAVQIPARKIRRELPLHETVEIKLGKLEKGEIKFACSMDMLTSQILAR